MKKRSRQQRNNLPLVLVGVGVLLVVGALIWQAISTSPAGSAATSGTTGSQVIPYPDIARVSLADAKTAFDSHSAVFLDVRDAGSYAAGHVPGAVNIPLSSLENRLEDLDPNQWIITYCT